MDVRSPVLAPVLGSSCSAAWKPLRAVGLDVATLPGRLKGSGTPGNLADHHKTDVIVRGGQ